MVTFGFHQIRWLLLDLIIFVVSLLSYRALGPLVTSQLADYTALYSIQVNLLIILLYCTWWPRIPEILVSIQIAG